MREVTTERGRFYWIDTTGRKRRVELVMCGTCGKEEWVRPGNKYCSMDCTIDGIVRESTCDYCGEVYGAKRGQRFCKTECARTWANQNRRKDLCGIPLGSGFWSKIQTGEGCWEWTGFVNKEGYGRYKVDGHAGLAHRLVFAQFFPKIDISQKDVHHACKNKKCVRPDHLAALAHNEHMAVTMQSRTVDQDTVRRVTEEVILRLAS